MEQRKSEPRFVKCTKHDIEDGNMKEYEWDKEKIYVEESLQDDVLMLQNVFEGMIISANVYPLIFEKKSERKETSLRSLEFYEEVQYNNDLYNMMPDDDKLYFLIGLRDLFVDSIRNLLSEKETKLLQEMVELVDKEGGNSLTQKKIGNLLVTPYPTRQNKVVKYVSSEPQTAMDEYFIRNELGLIMVFVDPGDLSYHNFENILNLDSLFKNIPESNFILRTFKKQQGHEIYTFDLQDRSSLLLSLDKYGLYIPPFNKLSRGGQRFIFSSERLSQALKDCFVQGISDKLLLKDKFRFVNYVFRYNKFRPQDSKFSSHYDTPYHDSEKKHYSKYTLLLYLTPGKADPVLSFDNGKFKIDSIDCDDDIFGIIFDQKYEHEGKPFISTDKIFLRSELIFEYDKEDVTFDDTVSKQFNIACYMTKQSVFNPELEKYASQTFDQSAKLRLNISKEKEENFKLIYKRYKYAKFITNGYDYWFRDNISLKEAATCLILDYFNCTFESGEAFNKQTYNETLDLKVNDIQEVLAFLDSKSHDDEEYKKDVSSDGIDDIEHSTIPSKSQELQEEYQRSRLTDSSHCCPYCYDDFNPLYCRNVVDKFEEKEKEFKRVLDDISDESFITILDQRIKLNQEIIQVSDSHITFDVPIPLINFAACLGYNTPSRHIIYETKNCVSFRNLPAIPYQIFKNGYHMKMELFNNSFVRREKHSVKYPVDLVYYSRMGNFDTTSDSD